MNNPSDHPVKQISSEGDNIRYPFDPLTTVIGLARRSYILILLLPVAVACAYCVAMLFSTKTYQAEAEMLYRVPGDTETFGLDISANTLVGMIDSKQNLELVREKLELPVTLKSLQTSVQIEMQRNTSLVSVVVFWDNSSKAAEIANTICNVYLDELRRLKALYTGQKKEFVQKQINEVEVRLQDADQELQAYSAENHIVDLDTETANLLSQAGSLATNLDSALTRQRSLRRQHDDLKRMIDELKPDVNQEQNRSSLQSASIIEANTRIQRLRELISEERKRKANEADLEIRKQEFDRVRKLYDMDAISHVDYEKSKAIYDRAQALLVESEEIKQWQDEIKHLDQIVAPPGWSMSPSSRLLENQMTRLFEIELEKIDVDEEVEHLQKASQFAKIRARELPTYRHELTELMRSVSLLGEEKSTLYKQLDQFNRQLADRNIHFELIFDAEPPLYSTRSNRKLLFAAIFCLIMGTGTLLVLMLTLTGRRILSINDIRLHLDPDYAIALPRIASKQTTSTTTGADSIPIPLHRLVIYLREQIPDVPLTLLLHSTKQTSPRHPAASEIAKVLHNRGERVLIVETGPSEFAAIDDCECIGRFDELLPMDEKAPSDVQHRTDVSTGRIHRIAGPKKNFVPENIGNAKFIENWQRLISSYTVTVIESPTGALSEISTEYLARLANVGILELESAGSRISGQKEAFRTFECDHVQVRCIILTKTSPWFITLGKEWKKAID